MTMTATSQGHAPARPDTATGLGRAADRDASTRRLAHALLWAALGWATFLWARGSGATDFNSATNILLSAGRLTGLLASVLLLAQVCLIARVPFLEQAFGQDRLVRSHRIVGFTSFNLMVAHIVLITWAYAGGTFSRTPATFWDLTVNYPGMLLAVAGTACLVLTVTTSIKAVRRRLRYESWHLLHLYAYLGVGLALPHQLWTGQDFQSSRSASVFWWSAWATAAGAIVTWRVGLPLWRNLRHRLRVSRVEREADGSYSVHLTGRALHRLPVQAGQFMNWRFLSGPGWTRGNPYSLSAAPSREGLRITVKEQGDQSSPISTLTPGTRAVIEGPYGRLTARRRTRRGLLFIGAGVGITPLRALAEAMPYAPGEATLLHRWTDQPLFADEFELLSHQRGLRVVDVSGPRRSHDSWLGSDALGRDDVASLLGVVPDVALRDVYICGPQPWADSVRASALVAGVPETAIHVEHFNW